MGMKQILVMMVAVVLVGCGGDSLQLNKFPEIEKKVREHLEQAKGHNSAEQLTDADFQKVTTLDLSDIQITDAGLKEVAKLQNLTELNLNNTQITDTGLKEVAKLQKLKFLHLNETKITDADVTKLKKALPNCRIFGP